ncbi:MAG: hypothetical protein KC535_03365 [Nanoarchaeota archaeon]|nr:hypothetical protein [Nanoarchaeota archaeon]
MSMKQVPYLAPAFITVFIIIILLMIVWFSTPLKQNVSGMVDNIVDKVNLTFHRP